ncbi:WG repeat-containing protein [Salegentibacter agarivorans]
MKNLINIFFSFAFVTSFAQEKFNYKIGRELNGNRETYSILNSNGDTIHKLDTTTYLYTFQSKFKEFVVFRIKGREGWSAIDSEQNYLFQVYQPVKGEPFPDHLIEDRIRIVGDNNRIGFADSSGEIIITPQFEEVTEFNNGYAIFSSECERIDKDNIKCEHARFATKCNKFGYIDKYGNIIEVGNFDFEKLRERINWKKTYR